MTEAIRQLPTIRLDQQGLTSDPSEGSDRTTEYKIYLDHVSGILSWSAFQSSRHPHTGEFPTASVTVVLPTVMIGSIEDIHRDIRDAVERHATRVLGDPNG
jgi:hypothetical protein